MTREEIIAHLNEIFRDLFMNDDIDLNDSTTAAEVDGWDSLSHINLIIAIETGLGIKLPLSEIENLRNVGELVTAIQQQKG